MAKQWYSRSVGNLLESIVGTPWRQGLTWSGQKHLGELRQTGAVLVKGATAMQRCIAGSLASMIKRLAEFDQMHSVQKEWSVWERSVWALSNEFVQPGTTTQRRGNHHWWHERTMDHEYTMSQNGRNLEYSKKGSKRIADWRTLVTRVCCDTSNTGWSD